MAVNSAGARRGSGIVRDSEQDEDIVSALQPGPKGGEVDDDEEEDQNTTGARAERVIRRAQVISRWEMAGLTCAFAFITAVVILGGAAVGLCVGIVGASRDMLWLAKGAGIGGAVGLVIALAIVGLIYFFIVKKNLHTVIYSSESRERLMNVT